MVVVGLAGAGCGQKPSPRRFDAAVAAAPPDLAHDPLPVSAALRCEECHGRINGEWRASAHARAEDRPLYRAMRGKVAAAALDECDRCHSPFTGQSDPSEPGAHEGVNCDACHAVREVQVGRAGHGFTLHTEENVKYGPICDAKDHYFHKMGCSPLHEEGKFCSGCHLWYRTLSSGKELPVFTEFEEWQDGPYGKAGMDCQRCHMPGQRAAVATGEKERSGVHGHGFLGADGKLRERALTLDVKANVADGRVRVDADVTNSGAGHHVPSGLPAHQVVLQVSLLDKQGGELERAERPFQRVLVDEKDAEAPFYAAQKVARDTRIAAKEVRHETFDLDAHGPAAQEVRVDLVWREASPAVAAALGIGRGTEVTMQQRRVRLGARRKGGN
jgi:hypothetical protein